MSLCQSGPFRVNTQPTRSLRDAVYTETEIRDGEESDIYQTFEWHTLGLAFGSATAAAAATGAPSSVTISPSTSASIISGTPNPFDCPITALHVPRLEGQEGHDGHDGASHPSTQIGRTWSRGGEVDHSL